ncbi:MAG: flagellar basal body P-ring formation chaperone FlgA [Magnetovibrionaceae bacterium]
MITVTSPLIRALLVGSLILAAEPALGGDQPDAPRAAPAIGVETASLPPAMEAKPVLREFASVNDKVVRLSDIFDNAGQYADRVLVRAPEPGKQVHYDYRWLARVARAYRLEWRPISRHDKVTIERAGHALPMEEIEASLLAALPTDVYETDMEVEISNRRLRLFVPIDQMATVRVEDIAYSPRSQRFQATIAAPAEDPAAPRYRLTGKVHRTMEIPVPTRRISARDIVRKRDIEWQRVRTSGLQHTVITDPEDLIGMSPRRTLRPGQPVRSADVQPPKLVKRGSQVTMVLSVGNMRLTATGKALEHGAKGDVIRVANSQSSQTVEATVTGTGKVSVLMAGGFATN